jgi:hypothetical protein
MNAWNRSLYVIAGLAALFVGASTIALAVRQGSWTPIVSVGWLPAVIVASLPGKYRRCAPRRRGVPG